MLACAALLLSYVPPEAYRHEQLTAMQAAFSRFGAQGPSGALARRERSSFRMAERCCCLYCCGAAAIAPRVSHYRFDVHTALGDLQFHCTVGLEALQVGPKAGFHARRIKRVNSSCSSEADCVANRRYQHGSDCGWR